MNSARKKQNIFWKMIIGMVILAIGFSGCVQEREVDLSTLKGKVVATVNGEDISADKLIREFHMAKRKFRLGKNEPMPEDKLLWLKTHTFNEIIEEVLLKQVATKNDVDLSEEEFLAFRSRFEQGYPDDSFEQSLEVVEISKDQWDAKLRTRLLIKKLIQQVVNSKVKISEDELKEYFKKNPEEFKRRERIRPLHILVKTEEEAQKLLKLIKKESEFSDLAREHSTAPESSVGGDMGYLEAGTLPEEFDPVFRLKPGGLSNIIRTPYGFHIFKVVEKQPASQRNFEESRTNIHARLLERKQEVSFQNWLKEIRDQAEIDIRHDVLEQIS